MWQRIKSLREERGTLVAEMGNILKRSENEKRDLTLDESAKFDELNSKAEAKLVEVERYQKFGDADSRSAASRFIADNDGLGNTLDSGTEVRALRSDELCADYIRSRGFASEKRVGFGQLMRAAILGAKTEEEKRALSEGTDSAGGYSVAPYLFADIIDKLRPATVCMASGAQVVPLVSNKNSFVKITADPAATWRAENASVNVADATFGQVQFVPKTLAVIVKASRELLEDSINANSAIEMAFANAFAVELDRVALLGDNGNGEPVGIANFSGVNSVSMGTNGAAITSYSKILDAVYECEADNAAATAIVANPRTTRTINGLTDSTGQPLRRPDSLASVPFRSTTGVPINQTQGSASNASTLFAGDFSRLWFGIRTDLRVEVLKETYAGGLQYGFLAYLRADVQASHENAFCKVVGIIP